MRPQRFAHVLPEGLGRIREPVGHALVGEKDGRAKLMFGARGAPMGSLRS